MSSAARRERFLQSDRTGDLGFDDQRRVCSPEVQPPRLRLTRVPPGAVGPPRVPATTAFVIGEDAHDIGTGFSSSTVGGRVIDPAIWRPRETHNGPSVGGTTASTWSPSKRTRLREICLSAAARAVRAPVRIPNCPWLDAIIARERRIGQ